MAKKIQFHYLFRDSGNYKSFGHKDYSNPNNLSIDFIKQELSQLLIDGIFFYPEHAGIQRFEIHCCCDDYSWYEMVDIEFVEGKSSYIPIEVLINRLKRRSGL